MLYRDPDLDIEDACMYRPYVFGLIPISRRLWAYPPQYRLWCRWFMRTKRVYRDATAGDI